MTVPIVLLVGPVVGFWIGGWIDRKTHTHPWFTIAFVGLGFAAAAREVVRLLKDAAREDGPGGEQK